jgi:hypothetical protein
VAGEGDGSALDEVARAAQDAESATARLTAAVATARRQGASWAQIGERAGMSRQAAHERWAKVAAQGEQEN